MKWKAHLVKIYINVKIFLRKLIGMDTTELKLQLLHKLIRDEWYAYSKNYAFQFKIANNATLLIIFSLEAKKDIEIKVTLFEGKISVKLLDYNVEFHELGSAITYINSIFERNNDKILSYLG